MDRAVVAWWPAVTLAWPPTPDSRRRYVLGLQRSAPPTLTFHGPIMRTNLLSSPATALVWLERDIPGKPPERIDLDRLPFTLGRNESCDYQILSSRVSREHAEIVRDAGVLKVRDLKST